MYTNIAKPHHFHNYYASSNLRKSIPAVSPGHQLALCISRMQFHIPQIQNKFSNSKMTSCIGYNKTQISHQLSTLARFWKISILEVACEKHYT